jgi:tRNA pseudouridine55 synthase
VNGFLVIDKPEGITSHDVVARVRSATGIRRVGHAGTLDPAATGVLVVGIGRATRLLRFVQDGSKAYLATVRFGIATDTLDRQGREVWRGPMRFTRLEMEEALDHFRGRITQQVPMVSAVKVGGRRLHQLAREGKEVERPQRQVEIDRLEVGSFQAGDFPVAVLAIECSKGTYVRVLADDLARWLGGRAHLEALRRTRVGPFTEREAITIDRLGEWTALLRPPLAAVAELPRRVVVGAERLLVENGRPLPPGDAGGRQAVIDAAGELLAVYRSDESGSRPEVVIT